MPPAKSTVNQSLKAGYVLSFVVLTLVMSFLYSAAPWIVAFAMSGPVDWNDVFRTAVPAVEHAVMWNDKLCVPQMELTFFNPGAMGHSLVLVDLKTNESRTIKTRIPPGTLKLVPDGDVLWCLNGSNVYRVQGDAVTTTPTGTTLTSVESAFLYKGTLAVLEESLTPGTIVGTSNYHLLVWTGSGWRDDGRVLLPVPIDVSDVDSAADSEASNAVIGFNGPVEIRVLNAQGKTHLFCSDGVTILTTDQIDIIPADTVSALAPENASTQVPNWTHVGSHGEFEVGVDRDGVLVFEHDVKGGIGTMRTEMAVSRMVDGEWKRTRTLDQAGFLIQSQIVSDGTTAWVVGMGLGNKLVLWNLSDVNAPETKLPVMAGATFEKLSQRVQNFTWWVGFPVVILYGLLASWLMASCRSSRYEFGNATVELASMNRRLLAKLVDWMCLGLPIMILQWVTIGTPSDLQEWMLDKFARLDVTVIRLFVLLMLAGLLYCLTVVVALGLMEGRWGISPGKWLLGIRVVRTTLRPCGFFRAVVREIMLLPDFMICFGWVPGAICVGMTVCWQRMGDLVGDTIVIRRPGHESVPEEDLVRLDA